LELSAIIRALSHLRFASVAHFSNRFGSRPISFLYRGIALRGRHEQIRHAAGVAQTGRIQGQSGCSSRSYGNCPKQRKPHRLQSKFLVGGGFTSPPLINPL